MTAPADLREALQHELGREIAVEREIARGPYFVVFEGLERGGRRVAVKVVPPQLAAENPTRAGRVLRAARVAATLSHPHVVPVLRVAAGDRLAWYVAPLEPGSLHHLLEQECELSPARAGELACQIAAALAAAHDRRLLHGDLTPAVVMLDERGAARVRDFGIAPAAEARLRPGPPPYDPHYLAPERLQGAGPTPASDQYALGVIAYQMLAGTRPYFGATPDMVRRRHLEQPVPDLRATRGDVPPAVAAAVERALAKRPEERFPSLTAFAAALRGDAAAPPQGRIPLIRDQHGRTRASPPRELVRPRVDPGRHARGGSSGGMPPAAAFALVAAGLLGLWLYVARTGPSDTVTPPHIVAAPLPEPPLPLEDRSFGASLPPAEAAAPAGAADSAPPEIDPAATERRAPPPRPQRQAPPRRTAQRAPAREPEPAAVLAPPAPRADEPTVGYLTVGSVPQGAIFVNGRLMQSNPVVALPVAAGPVRLRFEASDGNGRALEREMTINLGPGDSLNLGRVRLDRP